MPRTAPWRSQAARQTPGQIATLILPADTAWGAADGVAETAPPARPAKVSDDAVKAAAAMLRSGERATLLMGGDALRHACLELAGRIAAKTGCGILTEGANTRLERGAGRVQVERIPYVVERALGVMRAAGNLVLVGAREPVAFFAYPDKPSLLMPENARSTKLAGIDEDMEAALEALAMELGAIECDARRGRGAAPARASDRRNHAGRHRLHPRSHAARECDRRR